MTPRLVLFDIDGTLVVTGRAGVRGMNQTFRRLYGRDGALDGVPFAGRTDRAIVIDVMQRLGVEPTDVQIQAFRRAYLDQLSIEIRRPVPDHPSAVLPGVIALLDALAAQEGVVVALLTGNFVGGAEIKLQHFGLWERFRFGAFGDDHVDRRALVPIALQRARDAGVSAPDPIDVIVIGDTPHDVDCAKAHGARAVGVATGPFDRAALQLAGADLIVDTLEPVGRVMDWLAGER